MPKLNRPPKYCQDGKYAAVYLHGKKYRLGLHGTPESQIAYARFLAENKSGPALSAHKGTTDIVHKISSLTHAHPRSRIACGFYWAIGINLMHEKSLKKAISLGLKGVKWRYKGTFPDFPLTFDFSDDGYSEPVDYVKDLKHYKRMLRADFAKLPETEIKSSGYVVDTLEAALWCLLNTDNYRDCILKAVNLGEDTDTTAAVAGGLAGMFYGADAIPKEWLSQLARRDYIEELCENFYRSFCITRC